MKAHSPTQGGPESAKTQAPAAATTSGPGVDPAAAQESERDVYLRKAQAVVDQSNGDKDDAFWHAMNGGNQGVDKDGKDKPDEWYRGVYLTSQDPDAKVKGLHGGNTGDVATVAEFRKQIAEDLNFNNAFSEYKDEASFEKALIAKYGQGGPDRADKVAHIAKNLWAYATTGMDVSGTTNVAQLQGMLYSLDAMIRDASLSNTPHEGEFTIPGSDLTLDSLGDGYYGRASILECRMLATVIAEQTGGNEETILDKAEKELPPEEKKEEGPRETVLDGFEETKFIVDMSQSMAEKYPTLLAYMADHQLGDTEFGGMTDWDEDVRWSEKGELSQEEVAAMLGKANSGSVMNRENRMKNSDAAFADFGAGANESSVHQARETLKEMGPAPKNAKRQILVTTDEDDARPTELRALRDEANAAQVTVKVLVLKPNGYIEIVVNDLSDATLAALDRDLGLAPKDKKADGDRRSLVSGEVTAKERKSNDWEDTFVTRMSWVELARMEGIARVKLQ